MPYTLRHAFISQNPATVAPPTQRRLAPATRTIRVADPRVQAWSRLLILEQSTVLILRHLMLRLDEQPAESAATPVSGAQPQ